MQNFLVLPAIVIQTDLVAMVPRSGANQLASAYVLRLMPLPVDLPEFDIKQWWHERFHADAGNQWLRQQIAQIFPEDDTTLARGEA